MHPKKLLHTPGLGFVRAKHLSGRSESSLHSSNAAIHTEQRVETPSSQLDKKEKWTIVTLFLLAAICIGLAPEEAQQISGEFVLTGALVFIFGLFFVLDRKQRR